MALEALHRRNSRERWHFGSRGADHAAVCPGPLGNWIAEDLVISKNTVRSHIRSIYTKLDVHSRKELLEKLAQG